MTEHGIKYLNGAMAEANKRWGARPPIDGGGGGPHDPGMDDLVRRVDRMEGLLDEMKPLLARLDEWLGHLATRADLESARSDLLATVNAVDIRLASARSDLLAKINTVDVKLTDVPSKTYMWMIIGVLVATILAAGSALR
ncbi:MAG TPA: hypothetical protein VD995_05065 [Azospirillum sp.]|nr:hypothetical protein [Azospirillum sp.]